MKSLKQLGNELSGKKAYLLGLLAVAYGLIGYYLGYSDVAQAQEAVWAGLTAIALRAGIAKK